VPIPDPPLQRARQRIVLQGEIPNPIAPPPGCRFQTRCPLVQDVCRREAPPFEEKAPGHWAACFFR
jgi:oligopeptide/dipeptide ABC transporter ATP-binding protein